MSDRTNASAVPNLSPHHAKAVGFAAGAATRQPELAPEPEPPTSSWQVFLPTKFDEGSGKAVDFPVFGWQAHVQKRAQGLCIEQRDVKAKEKHGQDPVVCVIMQP